MTFAFAPSNAAARTCARAAVDARALAIAVMQAVHVTAVPPGSQGPGRP